MGRPAKYTKEKLETAVKEAVSMAELMRLLGLREAGGTHSHLTRKISEYNIDTSHFLGRSANSGKSHKGGAKKLVWQEVLVKRTSGPRQKAFRLRRALIESGRDYKCEECGLGDRWNNKELRLQVDHKNCNWIDDRPENLQFICPNCHTQTPGYNGSKGLSRLTQGYKKVRVMKRQTSVA